MTYEGHKNFEGHNLQKTQQQISHYVQLFFINNGKPEISNLTVFWERNVCFWLCHINLTANTVYCFTNRMSANLTHDKGTNLFTNKSDSFL